MTDFRALCAELLGCYRSGMFDDDFVLRARAALDEPDGPAVPESREPASVTGEPTDRELLELMPQQLREDMATVSRMAAHGAGTGVTPGLFRVSLNTGALDYARAVLARYGRQPAPPAEGEVGELVAQIRHFLAGYRQMRGLDPEHIYSIHRGDAMEAHITVSGLTRAADLLEQRHPAPVPVAERLPEPEDCDAEGQVWVSHEPPPWHELTCWTLMTMDRAKMWAPVACWLPATALPLPQGEVEP